MFRCVSSSKALRQRYLPPRVDVTGPHITYFRFLASTCIFQNLHNRILLTVVSLKRIDTCISGRSSHSTCKHRVHMAFVHEGYRKRSRHSIISFDCGCRVRQCINSVANAKVFHHTVQDWTVRSFSYIFFSTVSQLPHPTKTCHRRAAYLCYVYAVDDNKNRRLNDSVSASNAEFIGRGFFSQVQVQIVIFRGFSLCNINRSRR
jgi:hypothetical protein